ncbi:MAG: amidohydrolase [Alphaproteobacteria bacterium]|nr:amidohydrolase [Alphaproteobacteria bacterium]
MGTSRRDIFKGATGLALAAAAAPLASSPGHAAEQGQELAARSGAPGQRYVLKGGTIISMDARVGNIEKGDILIEGKKILEVGGDIVANVQAIDATNMIVIPGFVDAHRHAWEGQLRRINPNAPTLASYSAATHQGFAPHYRPYDMYAGNYISAIGCIDAGITCMIDNSHNSRSSEHSDEAIRALLDSGIRAVHGSGAPQQGEWDRQWPRDLERIKGRFFSSDDQLVTLRMVSGINAENWTFARRLGLSISTEFRGANAPQLEPLWGQNLIGPHNTFNHCGLVPDATWRRMKAAGVTVNVCPRSDTQYGLEEGFPAFQAALDHAMKPAFSVDNETSYSTDMFTEMRVAFHIQRGLAQNRKSKGDANAPRPISTREVLECATVNGALNAGLSDKIGSIVPGKEADLVMIRSDDLNLYPSNNAIGTVVSGADRGNIDTVIIGGKIRKFRGQMIGVDMARFKTIADGSRLYLFGKAGYKPDIFAAEFKI